MTYIPASSVHPVMSLKTSQNPFIYYADHRKHESSVFRMIAWFVCSGILYKHGIMMYAPLHLYMKSSHPFTLLYKTLSAKYKFHWQNMCIFAP